MDMNRIHEIALALNVEYDEARWMFDILINKSFDYLNMVMVDKDEEDGGGRN